LLEACDVPLWDRYDVAMVDLDGVVYIGRQAVPGAPEHLEKAAAAGMRVAYITNNAARPPAAVAEHLTDLGIAVRPDDVVTSAQAAARLLAERLPTGAAVFVIGGPGLFEALDEQSLRPVQSIADEPEAVVSGFHRGLTWGTVVDGAILVRRGLPWVASNTDLTVPTQEGPGPGNGALVDVVARFADREPQVAGKPKTPLFEETLRRVGGRRPLVVGDRLDTDIAGAGNVGYDSLLVLTGVTGLDELVRARPGERPTYVGTDLGALGRPQPAPEQQDDRVVLGGWTAAVHDGRLTVAGDGETEDWWRVVAVAAWRHLDDHDRPVGVEDLPTPGSVAPGR
jgi:HAD superfamily hydrolase (TIGR01450 family)